MSQVSLLLSTKNGSERSPKNMQNSCALLETRPESYPIWPKVMIVIVTIMIVIIIAAAISRA